MTILRMIDVEVDLATLRQRLEILETRILGSIDGLDGPQPLFSIYSHLQFDGITPSQESAALMQSCSLLLTPRNLLDLGRMTDDMFPWRPFLAALDLLEATGYNVSAATKWVQRCAEQLLIAQGLGVLRVEDVLKSPVGPVQELKHFALSEK